MPVNDGHVNLRLPAALVQALDAWATALGVTRSAVLRGLIKDAADVTELPTVPTRQEQLDDELERLREPCRDRCRGTVSESRSLRRCGGSQT